jgi:hypothetical protein
MNKRLSLSLLAALGLCQSVTADEGQWQPHQIAQLQSEFDRIGMDISATQVADLNQYPMNAVVGLGYCSASFVSPKGLVVTNHHCGYSAIQNNTTVENNLAKNGFLARSITEELSAGPQERLYITEQVTDVTDKVTGQLDNSLKGKKRFDAIETNRKKLIKDCETSADYRCSVRAFHHGMEYFLMKSLMIKDVRLVYAPPEAVGNFGGDIDNYEYPRHTGDFTFLRAYVDTSGTPAPFSKDNVPFEPKSWLKLNANGVRKGDGIILAGFPGSTSRYKLASEIAFAGSWSYPARIKMNNKTLTVIDRAANAKPQAKVYYSSTIKSINNRSKKYQGLLDGFKVTDIEGIKKDKEQALLDWIKQDAGRSHFAQTHQQLSDLLAQSQANDKRDFYYEYAQESDLLLAAINLFKLAKENEKPDAERKTGYQQRDVPMFKARLKRMQKRFTPGVDHYLWAEYLHEYLQQNKQTRVAEFDQILQLRPDASVQDLYELLTPFYKDTTLHTEATRIAWVGKSVSDFEKSDDPFIQLAVKLYPSNTKFEAQAEELKGLLAQIRPDYMKAIIAYNKSLGKPVYPDANSTLRITYGSVDGYPARDGVYKTPFTSLKGMIAKNTGVVPFTVPKRIMAAVDQKNFGFYHHNSLDKVQDSSWYCGILNCYEPDQKSFDSVPVNFLSSADTTGGNSGSPVMNAQGDLVGLNFDSTYESITKDWYFNAKITRAIHVDIRYVLWILDKVEHADNLLKEMTIIK